MTDRDTLPDEGRPHWRGPVFVGGTGRSGTSIVGRLLGVHPEYAAVPMEIRFHTETGGLLDVLDGAITPKRFARRLVGKWYYREREDGIERGLHRIVDRPLVERAARTFVKQHKRDPLAAARQLIHTIVDPVAQAEGKPAWVETTPATLQRATLVAEILPEARFVHMVRDGRDVAVSVWKRPWGPTDVSAGLEWWAERAEQAGRSTSVLPAERLLTMQFEALAVCDRDAQYRRLLEFCELDDHPAMRTYFDEKLSPERARVGRWRRDVPEAQRHAFEQRFEELVTALGEKGVRMSAVS